MGFMVKGVLVEIVDEVNKLIITRFVNAVRSFIDNVNLVLRKGGGGVDRINIRG